ncbi:MAG TPA: SusD/RagB family nutrient-binding outer membrane lipoprotein [Hanamia sp.]|nr:SusD/RagB family nutrient-binding outer membrane lipoprotein [Hanamia sp.]
MKMNIFYNQKKLIGLGLIGILLVISSGCKKQLNINQNPNFPTLAQGNPSLVFPVAVLATTGKVGGDLAIVGGMWSQYFTQAALANQYTDIDSYNMPATGIYVNQSYDIMFSSGLKNYQYVIDQSQASGDWIYYLMATVMKAYTTEVLVDLYDKIPYSDALKGAGDLNPKFDEGDSIYQDLLSSIDTALSKDFTASTNSVPGTQDLIFNGNLNNWIEFANTLKLKMYLRMVNANPSEAEAGITAMYNNGATFLNEDAAVTNFTNAPGLDNPFFEQNQRQLNTTTNIRASTTFVSWLEANHDPRIEYYFGSATPNSINQGDYHGSDPSYQTAPVFAQSPTDPVEFISLPESYFLQAEADLRYFGGLNTQFLYNQGVLAAFAQLGLDGSSFIAPGGAYAFPVSGTMDQKLEAIIVQKWASCAYGCHGIEAYFEKNRTGYPVSSPVYSTDPSYIPGQLVIAKNSVLPAGMVPKRFVFPYDETSRNTNSPAPVPSTTKVWWGL